MEKNKEAYIVQGHRGCTGVYPENSIAGFLKAIELGVNSIELDVVITSDLKLLVSHDPFMNHLLCVNKNGHDIAIAEERSLNIFKMDLLEAKTYVCGSKNHPDHPGQIAIKHHKPSLKELVEEVRRYCKLNGAKVPSWSIEIKSQKKWDELYHPTPEEYAKIIVKEVLSLKLEDFTIIGFDARLLNSVGKIAPQIKLGILNEEANVNLPSLLSLLIKKPAAYYVNYQLVTKDLIQECESLGLQLAVWTVNDVQVLKDLLSLGVKNIISDYPKMVLEAIKTSYQSV